MCRVSGPFFRDVARLIKATVAAVNAMGVSHTSYPINEFVINEQNRIITSSAYMLVGGISEAAEGIEKVVAALMKMFR